jgi:hypothetical protein
VSLENSSRLPIAPCHPEKNTGDKMKLFLKVLADRLGDLLRAVLLAAVAPSRQANRFDEGRGISVHWQVIRSDDAARQHKPAELRANATHGLRFRW